MNNLTLYKKKTQFQSKESRLGFSSVLSAPARSSLKHTKDFPSFIDFFIFSSHSWPAVLTTQTPSSLNRLPPRPFTQKAAPE